MHAVHKMRPIATLSHVARCVCSCVCVLVTLMYCAKTTQPIEVPLGTHSWVQGTVC